MSLILIAVALQTAAPAGHTIFERGQSIEVKNGPGWRPCIVTDPGDATRLARADCDDVVLQTYSYGAIEENFSAAGSSSVRLPGSCTTTSPTMVGRRIAGCTPAAAPVGAPPAVETAPAEAPKPQAALVAPLAPAPQGPAPKKLERCSVGMRVKTPGGLAATVVAAQGAGCTIKTDVRNTFIDGTYSAFMLTPIGTPPAALTTPTGVGRLPLGEYACYGSGMRVLAGLGFKLLGGGVYTDLDNKSRGRYAVTGSTVSFTGGHLGGQSGRDIQDNGFTIGAMVSCQKW